MDTLRLVPKEPGEHVPVQIPKPPPPNPPKARSMKEMNAVIDRILAELKAASNVYMMMNQMIITLKTEVIALKEGNKNGQHSGHAQGSDSGSDVRTETAADGSEGV